MFHASAFRDQQGHEYGQAISKKLKLCLWLEGPAARPTFLSSVAPVFFWAAT